MTRGERVLFGRVATGMDGIQCGYSAATADPFASVRDDKGESGYFSEESRLGWTRVRLLRSDCRSLRFGRDDKGRAGTFRKSRDWDGRNSVRLLRGDCRSLRFGRDDKGRAAAQVEAVIGRRDPHGCRSRAPRGKVR